MAGCRRCSRRVVVRRRDSAAGGATMTGEDFQASSRVTSRVSVSPRDQLPLLLTPIICAKRTLLSPTPMSASSLASPPRPCLVPVFLRAGSGPFVSPAWSAISIHSFAHPPLSPSFILRAKMSSLSRVPPVSPGSPSQTWYISLVSSLHPAIPPFGTRRPASCSLPRGTIASLCLVNLSSFSVPRTFEHQRVHRWYHNRRSLDDVIGVGAPP